MASLDEAFPPLWETEYNDIKDRERREQERVKAELFEATFGIPFSELQTVYPSNVLTKDGSVHYVHTRTGDRYRYVYAFGDPHWIGNYIRKNGIVSCVRKLISSVFRWGRNLSYVNAIY